MPKTKEMTESKSETSIDLFPFQLVNVRIYSVKAGHCPIEKGKKADATFKVSLSRIEELPDSNKFGLLLSFNSTIPVEENIACNIELAVEGLFQSQIDKALIKPEVIKRFESGDSAVLLWPYLRQYVQDLTTRMGLSLPPLPTLDVRALLEHGAKKS